MSRIGGAVLLVLAVAAGAVGHALLDRDTAADRPPAAAGSKKAGAHGPPRACWQRTGYSSRYAKGGGALRCFNLPGRLVPPGSVPEATAVHELDRRTFLISFDRYKEGFYRVWQRQGRAWTKLFERASLPDGPSAISLEDVTQDDRRDVLVQGLAGSGLCGARDVLAVEARRVRPLILRTGCEVLAGVTDGLVYLREAIGSCKVPRAHCYGGVRITIRGWTGRRVTTDQQIVRCLRRESDPRRHCRET